MSRETLDTVLSLPGVLGIALLGKQSRAYFYRSFQELGKQQDTLVEGLFQVLNGMPIGFDFFEFQFAQQRVFVYPLDQEWVLLVAVNEQIDPDSYTPTLSSLRVELMQDTQKAVETLRLYLSESSPPPTQETVSLPPPPLEPTMKDMVKAINQLCRATSYFLGRAVIVKYWRTTREELLDRTASYGVLLGQFEVDRTAEIRYTGKLKKLTPEQHRILRLWVNAFLLRCEKVIRNFRSLLKAKAASLSDEDWKLLS